MTSHDKNDREARALDALAVAALRDLRASGNHDDLNANDALCLSPDDLREVERRAPEILKAVLAGTWSSRTSNVPSQPQQVAETAELAGAFNRTQGDGDITPAAREEMDAKRRELDEEDKRTREP